MIWGPTLSVWRSHLSHAPYCTYNISYAQIKSKRILDKVLDKAKIWYIICYVALGNCVTVARQTLTLFVGVRIPIPQPKIIVHPLGWAIIFCFLEAIHRDSNKGGLPQGKLQPFGERLQSPWATSVSEAIAHGSVRKNPSSPAKNNSSPVRVGYYFFVLQLI